MMNSKKLEINGLDTKQWSSFLAQHNLTWSHITDQWDQGAFIGNGMMGAMIYKDKGDILRWELGRCDVLAHFQFNNIDWADPRVPIGDFLLTPVGSIQKESMELDLWNAQVKGTIKTALGMIEWRSFVHAEDMVMAIELETSGAENQATLEFRAQHGISPCLEYDYTRKFLPNDWWAYLPLYPKRSHEGDSTVSVQAFLKGGECVTAWQEKQISSSHRILYCSITNSFPERCARAQAIDNVQRVVRQNYREWDNAHQAWWHNYYSQSFISLPDTRWEAFYWIQMYKLASATRANRALIDSQGPWLTKTPWPTCVWNLNVQLSYSPVFTANRLSLAESLANTLDVNLDQLIANVPEPYRGDSAAIGRSSSCTELHAPTNINWEVGNLTWVCHNYYRLCRYAMDMDRLRDHFYPLLRRAVNFYLHILYEGTDGKLHLPPTHSPEYGRNLTTRDANYDLALVRWGCQILINICTQFAIDDDRKKDWHDVLERLVDPPVDENGLRVGRDLPFAMSHRHFSHLLAIFPLHVMNPEQPDNRELICKSLKHWISFEGALQGYSFTGASAIAATLGQGNDALRYINYLREFLSPNTMYVENGPVIETPLAAADSLQMMLLQSWGGKIRVFPAVADLWQDLIFHNLRAEGGFLVSAVRAKGQTQWIHITSLAGEPCRIKADGLNEMTLYGPKTLTRTSLSDGTLELNLAQGDTVVLYRGDRLPYLTIVPLAAHAEDCHYYGMTRPFIAEQSMDGIIELPSTHARIHGDTITYLKSADKNKIGDWSNVSDWIEWPLRLHTPGRFNVIVTYACPQEQAGGRFTFASGQQSLTAKVEPTRDWETYNEITLGTITLGQTNDLQCVLRATEIPSTSLMDLRCIRLVPCS